MRVNFFSFLSKFFFKFLLHVITANIRKSGKLYVIPKILQTKNIYKYFFKTLYSQIILRPENTLQLKFLSECSSYKGSTHANFFLLFRQNLCKLLLENKQYTYLIHKY